MTAGADRGNWMQTYTGRMFFPTDPRPEEVTAEDIAHALSLVCRFGGHVDRFYSVAEHCWLMSFAVPPEHALWALLHDAAEAYVGDMVRPLKQQMPDYCFAEGRVLTAIMERFGMDYFERTRMPDSVREADNRILLTERAALMSAPPPAPWGQDGLVPLDVAVRGVTPREAERLYLDRLDQLTGVSRG